MTKSNFTRSYNDSSEVTITIEDNNKVIGKIQGFSYSISREMAPIYTMKTGKEVLAKQKRAIVGYLTIKELSMDLPKKFFVRFQAANEYGTISEMHAIEVELIDPATGFSPDSIKLLKTYNFVCKELKSWHNIKEDEIQPNKNKRIYLSPGRRAGKTKAMIEYFKNRIYAGLDIPKEDLGKPLTTQVKEELDMINKTEKSKPTLSDKILELTNKGIDIRIWKRDNKTEIYLRTPMKDHNAFNCVRSFTDFELEHHYNKEQLLLTVISEAQAGIEEKEAKTQSEPKPTLSDKILGLAEEGITVTIRPGCTVYTLPGCKPNIRINLQRKEIYYGTEILQKEIQESELSKDELILEAIERCEKRLKEKEEESIEEKKYNGFSGVDIKAVDKSGNEICMLTGVSYAVHREPAKLPYIDIMGSVDPRTFKRGRRTITGSAMIYVKAGEELPTLPDEGFNIIMQSASEEGNLSEMKLISCKVEEYSSEYINFTIEEITPWVNIAPEVKEATFSDLAKRAEESGWIDKLTLVSKSYVSEQDIILEKEDHTGQTYNPYTGKWSWI